MKNAVAAFVFHFLYLALAFDALNHYTFLNSQRSAGATTCGEAPLLDSAAEVLPPLATLLALFVAVALIYRHLMSRHIAAVPVPVAAAGNGRRSVSALVVFLLCISAGTIESIVFRQAAGGGGGAGHGAQARALGMAALHAMPAAATLTFFCGMVLILAGVAQVPTGGEAAGGAAVAGDGPVQAGAQRLLTKVAAGAAAALVGLMVMALTLI